MHPPTSPLHGPVFDGGAFAGREPVTGLDQPVETLLRQWDLHGISRGLVGSYRAIYQDSTAGNREALRWASKFPGRIEPLGILVPQRFGEEPEKHLAALRAEGFRAVAVLSEPAYYPVDWDTPSVRALGAAAASLGLVVVAGIRSEAELGAVARAWGDLGSPVLLRWVGGHRYLTLASEIAVARRCPHFFFDVGTLCSLGAVEVLAERIGANRLYVASNTPHHLSGPPLAVLREALLETAQRRDVEAGTLQRLLPPQTPAGTTAEPPATPLESLRPLPKVDVHWHHDGWNLGEPGVAPERQRACFERWNYLAVVSSSSEALNHDLRAGNDSTERWIGLGPRRFGWIVVNPTEPGLSLAEIARRSASAHFVGIKTIQDAHGLALDDPAYEPILEEAGRRDLTVLAHLGGMDRAAERFPSLRFIAAHANWGRARHLASRSNVAFDLSTSHALRSESQLSRFAQVTGTERILFGSDGPLIDPAWTLAKLQDALPRAALDDVFHRNALRWLPRLAIALSANPSAAKSTVAR